MSPTVITLIAWTPFIILALIFCLAFSFKGYKRGAARAGISIGVTALTCIISILIAKLIAMGLSGTFAPIVENALSSSGIKMGTSELASLATSIASAFASLILYIPVSIILFSVLKPVASFIVKRYIPEPKHPANKIGGLSISVVDALLLAMLLTLPIYGTLSLVDGAISATGVKDSREMKYVSAVTDPFVVDVASVPPFSTAYDALMSCKIGNSTVSISGTVREATVLIRHAQSIGNIKKGDFSKKDVIAFLNGAEKLVTKNDFAADFICEYLGKKAPSVKMPGLGKTELNELYPALSDAKQLKKDLPAFFDLTKAMVKSGMMQTLSSKDPDMSKVNAATASKAFGKTLNNSTALATLKSNLLNSVADSLSKEIIDAGKDKDGSVQMLCDAIKSIPSEPMSKKDANKEGESFYLIVSGLSLSSKEKTAAMGLGMILEGLARHPMVGSEKVMNAAGVIMENSGVKLSDVLLSKMTENLTISLGKPITENSFGNYCNTAFITLDAFEGIVNRVPADGETSGTLSNEGLKNLITADKESLSAVKDTVSSDLMADIGIDEAYADSFKGVVDATFDAIIDSNCSKEEAEKEAEALGSVLEVVTGVTQNPENTADIVREYTIEIVEECLDSKIVTEMILDLTEGGRTDPFGLFVGMPEEDKASVEKTINEYIANAETAERVAVLEAYKLFVGISNND